MKGEGLASSCDAITTKWLGIYKRICAFYLKLTIMLVSMSCLFYSYRWILYLPAGKKTCSLTVSERLNVKDQSKRKVSQFCCSSKIVQKGYQKKHHCALVLKRFIILVLNAGNKNLSHTDRLVSEYFWGTSCCKSYTPFWNQFIKGSG